VETCPLDVTFPFMEPSNPDVVIIGAGVVGASIALELQRAGRSVTVVDKGEAVGGGSTSASSALIRFNYSTRSGVVAAWESLHLWKQWAKHLGPIEGPLVSFLQTGMLLIEPPEFDRAPYRKNFDALGIDYEELDNQAFADRFPSLETGRFWPPVRPDQDQFFADPAGLTGAFYPPQAGFIDDPQLAASNLMDAARRHGTIVRLRSEVAGILRQGNQVTGVKLANGTSLTSSVVVNAAGPWSSQINLLAGVSDDVAMTPQALRQEVHVVPASDDFSLENNGLMVADLDLGFYMRPQSGGTMIVGGVEADCDPKVWVDDPDEFLETTTVDLWEAQVWRSARRLPSLAVPNRPVGLASLYDVTPDWTPIYDRTCLDGFYLACGTSGNQFKNAPLIGIMMETLITACENGQNHDHEPVQVPCIQTGLALDLGTFSRNRTPISSTGTVLG